jgi:CheY-like chemotaxis protein
MVLAREIRRQGETPLVLLSASGDPAVGEEAGLFQAQVTKPIKHSQLFQALVKIIGPEARPGHSSAVQPFDRGLAKRHPLSILLAEDNLTNQKVGLLMLSRFGYSADLAVDGHQAVEAAQKTGYDLILMDVQMPGMNGIEATHRIREQLGPKCPTIIALSAEALEGDEARLLGEGFDAYLSKPLQVSRLEEKLRTVPRVS